jgi:hypothetical protein
MSPTANPDAANVAIDKLPLADHTTVTNCLVMAAITRCSFISRSGMKYPARGLEQVERACGR